MEREFINMKDIFKILPTTQEEKEYMIVSEAGFNAEPITE